MTTSNMQFGQSAISVVLNEGQFPLKYTTNATGTTSVVGAGGTMSVFESPFATTFPTQRNGTFAPYSVQPYPLVKRRMNWGELVTYSGASVFASHTNFTTQDTTTGWTLSTVSGVNGISDTGAILDGTGSRTGQANMLLCTQDGTTVGGTIGINFPTIAANNNGRIGLWIYMAASSTSSAYVKFTLSKNTNFTTYKEFDANNYQISPGWNYIQWDDNVSTTPTGVAKAGTQDITSGTLQKVRISITPTSGKTAKFYFDSMWTNIDKPISRIIIGKDGTGESDLSLWHSLLSEQGWKGALNFDCTGSNDMTPLTSLNGYGATGGDARIQSIYDDGWDVFNHSLNHNTLASLTTAQIEYVIKAQRNYQLANGWSRGAEMFSAAQNVTTEAQRLQIKNLGFSLIRGWQNMDQYQTPFGIANPFSVGCDGFDNLALSTIKAKVLTRIQYGTDLWIFGHNITAGDGGDATGETVPGGSGLATYENTMRLFLQWLKTYETAGQVVVCTPTEWFYGLK